MSAVGNLDTETISSVNTHFAVLLFNQPRVQIPGGASVSEVTTGPLSQQSRSLVWFQGLGNRGPFPQRKLVKFSVNDQ